MGLSSFKKARAQLLHLQEAHESTVINAHQLADVTAGEHNPEDGKEARSLSHVPAALRDISSGALMSSLFLSLSSSAPPGSLSCQSPATTKETVSPASAKRA